MQKRLYMSLAQAETLSLFPQYIGVGLVIAIIVG
jgi:hypothetical protein